ncbi:MAG TPA: type IV pilus assembly protein PilM [Acidimicrobiales bacterium]|nr:type IV pilus assembly protein PilM [Acidimicrobiales bacterium]
MSKRIGLEISTTAVRMAEIASSDGRPRLLTFAQVRLPAGAVVDGMIVDPQAVEAAIQRCKSEGGFGGAMRRASHIRVRLSVSGLQAIMREIEMPPVPPDEVDAAVRLQAIDIIPFPEDKTLFAARALGTGTDQNGAPAMRVLLAAAHRDLVVPFVECAQAAGLQPEGVELAASALVRALDQGGDTLDPQAVVSIGADLTTVVVHQQGDPLFVRTIAEGGNVITQALATALDLPLADAEKLKRHLGDERQQVPPEALHAAREGSARLLSEIRSSVDYFAALPGRGEVRRVIVTGAGSQLAELVERLQLQLIAPVSLGSVFEFLDISDIGADLRPLDPVDLSGAVAVGLALPQPPGIKELDLLPQEVRTKLRRRRIESRVIAAAVFLLLLLVLTGVLRWNSARAAASQVATLQGQIQQVNAVLPRYNRVRMEHEELEQDQAIAVPLVVDEVNWNGALDALGKYLPKNVIVTSFSGTALAQVPDGASADNLPPPTAVLAQIQISLQGTQYDDFQSWLSDYTNSQRFGIEDWTSLSKSRNIVTWSSQVELLATVHTARLGQYEVAP